MARSTLIVYLVIGLTITGLFFITSASVISAAQNFQDKWHYLKLQSLWATLGLVLFLWGSKFNYSNLEKTSKIFLFISLLSLLLVLIPGIGSNYLGARRWINIGGIGFQPSELAKFSLCLYFASLLKKKPTNIIFFATVLVAVCFLIMLQPDLGTTIVILIISLLLYFASGTPAKHFFYLLVIGTALILAVILVSPYRRERLLTFFNPNRDPQGSSYHIRQALLSIGSGGIWGIGVGQSRQKYDFLPEVTTDSIFAVIAEELGFVGSSILITTYLTLVIQGLETAKAAKSEFGSLLALGITSWIGGQSLVNLAAMVALFPLTGIPLPFVSYGGTSLVLLLFASGILVNIAKNK